MDGIESIFISKKEACKLVGLSIAQVDRLRRAGDFPSSYELTGAPNGKIGLLRSEVSDWCLTRKKRKLRPPADDSFDEVGAHLRL
jgi:predicted DNA-binding transcriptional regulator AlpA